MTIPHWVLHYLEEMLYRLHYVEDLKTTDLFPGQGVAGLWKQLFSAQEIKDRIASLEWALMHHDVDFQSKGILQALPYSNSELVFYIERLLQHLQAHFSDEVLETLKVPDDDRPLKILLGEEKYYDFYGGLFAFTPYKLTHVHDAKNAWEELCANSFDLLLIRFFRRKEDTLQLIRQVRKVEQQPKILKTWPIVKWLPPCPALALRQLPIPIIALVEEEDQGYIQMLYEAGCTTHFIYPHWKSTLLKEVYRLTTPGK